MVEIRVQLDGSYNLCRSIQYPSLFIRAAGPLRVAFSALLAAAIIVAFIIREQCQISIKFQEDKERSAHLSYSKICRRFLPALCEGRPVVSGRIFEKLDCTKVRNNRYFQERKCFHGYPQFLLSPEKAADLMNLVRFVSTFKDRDQAAGPRIAVRVLHSTLIKQIVCLLKRSVWISAKLETVYNRIGGGGCKFVSRQLLDGLEYLISAIPKRDKEESPDENVVAAVRFLIGSIPLVAECSQLVDQDYVNQFIEELKLVRTKEDIELYHLPPRMNSKK